MPEEDGIPLGEKAPADQVNQSRGGPPGVDRVQQQGLFAGKELHGLNLGFAQDGVARAGVGVIDPHLFGREPERLSEEGRGLGCQVGNPRLEHSGRFVHADPENPACKAALARAHQHAGLRAAGGAGEDDPVRPAALPGEFQHRVHIAARAGGVGAAIGDQIGLAAVCLGLLADLGQFRRHLVPLGEDQFRSQQVEEKVVAIRRVGRIAKEHQDAVQAELGRRGCRLAAMVGLDRARGDQRACALALGLRQQIFQLAGFVAAQGQPGLVIAFDQQLGALQGGRQPRQGFNRRRQVGKMESLDHALNPLLVSDFPRRRMRPKTRGSTWL